MKSAIRFGLQWGIIAVLAVFLVRYLQTQWGQLTFEFTARNLVLLLVAQVAYTAGMALLPYNSWRMQRWFGHDLSPYVMWRAFYLAQFVKYLPGGIWSIPGRAVLYHRSGVPAGESGALVLLEIFGMILGSSFVGLLSLPVLLPTFAQYAVPVTLLGVAGAAALALILWLTRARWLPALRRVSLSAFVAVCGVYALNWVALGIAFALIAVALDLPVGLADVLLITGIHAVAWVAGFVVVITPGGIGVRDAILAIGLAPFFAAPFPIIISLLARIGWTLAEISGFLIVVPLLRRIGGNKASETAHSNPLP